ncbi:hypothetical protein LTR86_004838 [Recurvomyces mirabilis]|nr:hypothetical protein LTR86_004838 [Recurvomyces mirabilis]
MAYPKRCDDGKLHRTHEDDQHLGWNGSWSPNDPPSGVRKRVPAMHCLDLGVAVNDNEQLATPFASQDYGVGSLDRPSHQPSRFASPDTPTPGDGLLENYSPATSTANTSIPSPPNISTARPTPAVEQDFQIFSSPRRPARRTIHHRHSSATSHQSSRQSPSDIANNMNLSNHHRAMASLSPSSTILVPGTEFSDDTPTGHRHKDILGSSDASDAEPGSDNKPFKKIADRARERAVRLTETVESGTWLLRRATRQHKFDVAELARSQALSAQLKQERDAAIADADGKAAAVAAQTGLVVARKDGRVRVLGWVLVLSTLVVLGYIYWCWRNSAEFSYIEEVRRKFYDTKSA